MSRSNSSGNMDDDELAKAFSNLTPSASSSSFSSFNIPSTRKQSAQSQSVTGASGSLYPGIAGGASSKRRNPKSLYPSLEALGGQTSVRRMPSFGDGSGKSNHPSDASPGSFTQLPSSVAATGTAPLVPLAPMSPFHRPDKPPPSPQLMPTQQQRASSSGGNHHLQQQLRRTAQQTQLRSSASDSSSSLMAAANASASGSGFFGRPSNRRSSLEDNMPLGSTADLMHVPSATGAETASSLTKPSPMSLRGSSAPVAATPTRTQGSMQPNGQSSSLLAPPSNSRQTSTSSISMSSVGSQSSAQSNNPHHHNNNNTSSSASVKHDSLSPLKAPPSSSVPRDSPVPEEDDNQQEHDGDDNDDESYEDDSEEETLRRVLEESMGTLPTHKKDAMLRNIESIQSLCKGDGWVDPTQLDLLAQQCEEDQKTVGELSMRADDMEHLEELIHLSERLLNACEMAKQRRAKLPTKPPATAEQPQKVSSSMQIPALVHKKDIFSLICLLRAQHTEERLDAATALMRFARLAHTEGSTKANELREEIHSSGGLHSLLTVFLRSSNPELQGMAALAIAYVLPSSVVSSGTIKPDVGLKIMECLRFLRKSKGVRTPQESVSSEECAAAGVMGLTCFWINQLEPMLRSTPSIVKDQLSMELYTREGSGGVGSGSGGEGGNDPTGLSVVGRPEIRRTESSAWKRHQLSWKRERDESAGVQELLEVAVGLVVEFAQQKGFGSSTSGVADSVLLVEQVCAIEAARPIAVREGILRVLVKWIQSGDASKTRPATTALRHLTSVKDQYLAGWIHSQMVSSGALPAIVTLTRDIQLTSPVRLAIAQILSSLCIAPHTRAAVVEADCLHFLIDLLYYHSSSEELAFFAGQALLQLAAGAMKRAGVLSISDKELMGYSSRGDRHDRILNEIVARGSIASFVSIAIRNRGRLRIIAIKTLRILSEDTNPTRNTRRQLCEDGAARALGETLMDCAPPAQTGAPIHIAEKDLEEIYQALCALSNILDPATDGKLARHVSTDVGEVTPTKHLLITTCLQTIESGGLKSMVALSGLPLREETGEQRLIEEACHALSLLAPFLLCQEVASKGHCSWADQVLRVFCYVASSLGWHDFDKSADLHASLLQGISALAKAEPLKVRIVDRILPYLIHAKNSRDHTHVSLCASQAFQSLEFAEDEVEVQTAGNNVGLLADWFCLQRSLLIQTMARAEIKRFLVEHWGEAFSQSHSHHPGLTKLVRKVSDRSRTGSDDGSSAGSDFLAQLGGSEASDEQMNNVIRQYEDIFGTRAECTTGQWKSTTTPDNTIPPKEGLLHQQVYPLNTSDAETSWILSHARSVGTDMRKALGLSDHVNRLLDHCFPSRLLRDLVIPCHVVAPGALYNFRAIMMPQRRYFSFRREGLLLSQLHDKDPSSDTSEVHWTLNFTNSTFGGEFPESLVQALYLCPVIRGLCFVGGYESSVIPPSVERSTSKSKVGDNGGLFSKLVGQLPPWVSHLTFDRVLDDRDMRSLIAVFETLGRLTASQTLTQQPHKIEGSSSSNAADTQAQGRFAFLAIRHSSDLSINAWNSFFDLIARPSSGPMGKRPLSSLQSLDLSGNGLGDEMCATLIQLILDRSSQCQMKELDLSGNRIGAGEKFVRVISWHAESYSSRGMAWRFSLRTLMLSSNGLYRGKAWLQLLELLKTNLVELDVLDLSSNGLTFMDSDYNSDMFVSSLLRNQSLKHLNLSDNKFSHLNLDEIMGQLLHASSDLGLPLVDFTRNSPELTADHKESLRSISRSARNSQLKRYSAEKEAKKTDQVTMPSAPMEVNVGVHGGRMLEKEETMLSAVDTHTRRSLLQHVEQTEDNKITVLFSAPLVFKDTNENLRPFAKLDFEMERELMWQCLKEASRDIELSFDSATHDRLLATMSKRCSCLHYSGHGNEHYLPFEDGKGGPNWFEVEDIKKLIVAREGDVPFRFVFVSACYSGLAGETFASAGVPHVVCCRQEFELKDAAALAFTRQFYLALAEGHTVKESFELGCRAVRATPNLLDAEKEMEKFVLLPRDGNHDVPIFNAKPLPQWPRPRHSNRSSSQNMRGSVRKITTSGSARSEDLEVRNLIQEDPSPSPPQFFLGREVDMYIVLNLILSKRLVSIGGDVGVGRSSLVCALCHYINERCSTMNQIKNIYYVKARQGRKTNRVKSLVQKLFKKLVEFGKATPHDVDNNDDIETWFDVICQSLKYEKALIVFDRMEVLEGSDEANEFPMLLSNLFRETRNVRVLLTARDALGIASIGGQVEHFYNLGPLTFANSVRLFASLCPFMHTPADRHRLFEKMVTDIEVAELLPTDPGLSETVQRKYELIGNGIPSNIEKAAYNMTKDVFMSLLRVED